LIVSLGISLPCLVIPADLLMACTLAYRRRLLLTVRYSTRTARRWLWVEAAYGVASMGLSCNKLGTGLDVEHRTDERCCSQFPGGDTFGLMTVAINRSLLSCAGMGAVGESADR
jgi:hypothetical protein